MDLKEIRRESFNGTNLAKDRDKWCDLVNKAINFQVLRNEGNFSPS